MLWVCKTEWLRLKGIIRAFIQWPAKPKPDNHPLSIFSYFFISKACIRSSFVTIFYFNVTVIVVLIAGSKKLSAVVGGVAALVIWLTYSEKCVLAFTAINEWMTFPVVMLLIYMSNFKIFVFEVRVVWFRMARKIGWFHPFIGYVFVTKHTMRRLMT